MVELVGRFNSRRRLGGEYVDGYSLGWGEGCEVIKVFDMSSRSEDSRRIFRGGIGGAFIGVGRRGGVGLKGGDVNCTLIGVGDVGSGNMGGGVCGVRSRGGGSGV